MKEYYHNISEVTRDLQNGKLCGTIYFSQNFFKGMQNRVEDYLYAEDSDLNASLIQVSLDKSDIQISSFIKRKLSNRTIEIMKDIMRDCKYSIKLADLPVKICIIIIIILYYNSYTSIVQN